MKKNIIIFTTRPITSKYTKSLIEQMRILKEYQANGYNLILWTPKTLAKNTEYILQVSGVLIDEMVCYIDDYRRCMVDHKPPMYDTWYEFLDKEDWISQFENVSDIVIFGAMLSDAAGLTRKKNVYNSLMNKRAQMNFIQNGSYLCALFQLVKLSRERKIPIHEICYDPCEISLDLLTDYSPHKLYCYHGYDDANYKFQRLDSLQSYLEVKTNNWLENYFENDTEEVYDFTFGMTVLAKNRLKQYEDLMNGLNHNENLKANLFIRHKELNIDTFISRDEYLDFIKKSRYTLLIPSYDIQHFSVYRFIESIYNNCLPLITSDVCYDSFAESFDIDKEFIKKITVDYSTIGNKMNEINEDERLSILNYFKSKCLSYDKKLNIGL